MHTAEKVQGRAWETAAGPCCVVVVRLPTYNCRQEVLEQNLLGWEKPSRRHDWGMDFENIVALEEQQQQQQQVAEGCPFDASSR